MTSNPLIQIYSERFKCFVDLDDTTVNDGALINLVVSPDHSSKAVEQPYSNKLYNVAAVSLVNNYPQLRDSSDSGHILNECRRLTDVSPDEALLRALKEFSEHILNAAAKKHAAQSTLCSLQTDIAVDNRIARNCFSEDLDWRPLHFVKPLPRNRLCSLCGLVRKTAALLPCGHIACGPCFKQCVADDGHACPIDGEDWPEEEVEWSDFPTENLLKREGSQFY
ncbi:hypothetical protein MTO96_034471 [Rhipicephalus appendiculatus]